MKAALKALEKPEKRRKCAVRGCNGVISSHDPRAGHRRYCYDHPPGHPDRLPPRGRRGIPNKTVPLSAEAAEYLESITNRPRPRRGSRFAKRRRDALRQHE